MEVALLSSSLDLLHHIIPCCCLDSSFVQFQALLKQLRHRPRLPQLYHRSDGGCTSNNQHSDQICNGKPSSKSLWVFLECVWGQ